MAAHLHLPNTSRHPSRTRPCSGWQFLPTGPGALWKECAPLPWCPSEPFPQPGSCPDSEILCQASLPVAGHVVCSCLFFPDMLSSSTPSQWLLVEVVGSCGLLLAYCWLPHTAGFKRCFLALSSCALEILLFSNTSSPKICVRLLKMQPFFHFIHSPRSGCLLTTQPPWIFQLPPFFFLLSYS